MEDIKYLIVLKKDGIEYNLCGFRQNCPVFFMGYVSYSKNIFTRYYKRKTDAERIANRCRKFNYLSDNAQIIIKESK